MENIPIAKCTKWKIFPLQNARNGNLLSGVLIAAFFSFVLGIGRKDCKDSPIPSSLVNIKRSSPPVGAKGNCRKLAMNFHEGNFRNCNVKDVNKEAVDEYPPQLL